MPTDCIGIDGFRRRGQKDIRPVRAEGKPPRRRKQTEFQVLRTQQNEQQVVPLREQQEFPAGHRPGRQWARPALKEFTERESNPIKETNGVQHLEQHLAPE